MPFSPQIGESVRAQVTVRGLVQGVNFRWYTQRRASEMHLTGYIQNMPDGSVHAIAEGPRESVERLLEVLRVGPAAAVVENVTVEWSAPRGEFDRFEVKS